MDGLAGRLAGARLVFDQPTAKALHPEDVILAGAIFAEKHPFSDTK